MIRKILVIYYRKKAYKQGSQKGLGKYFLFNYYWACSELLRTKRANIFNYKIKARKEASLC